MDLAEFVGKYGLFDVYAGYDAASCPVDIWGWNSEHPMFETVIERVRPSTIIEVGSYQGASALHMAKVAREKGLKPLIVCVDNWLGEGWLRARRYGKDLRPSMFCAAGQLKVLQQFMTNVISSNFADTIVPFVQSANAAAECLKEANVTGVDAIYIDARHEEEHVYSDIIEYWPLLRSGGILFGDDYHPKWPGVVKAVHRFCAENALLLETLKPKWVLVKN